VLFRSIDAKAPLASPSFTGNVSVGGTVDGRDLATDGTKLDGIEAGADVTDTANVTAAGAVMDSELTSEASVKALDQGVATTNGPTFAGATLTNTLNVTPTSGYGNIEVGGVDGAFIDLKSPSSDDYDMRLITAGGSGGTIDVGAAGDLSLRAGGSEKVTLLSSGNVGIGTSSPEAKLHISTGGGITPFASSQIVSESSGNNYIELNGGSTSTTALYFGDSADQDVGGVLYNHSDNSMSFRANAASRMTINSVGTVSTTGSIGVGRTSLSAATEDAGLVLASQGYIYSVREGTSSQSHIVFINNAAVTATTAGSIRTSGSTTSYNTSSDYRLKTDAQPMTGATARLKALKPVNFEWIADGTRVDGFLAHEAQEVVPECVSGEKDAMQDQEYEVTPEVLDEEGNTVEEAVMGTRSVPEYQGIDQSKLVPLLVATIQELEARITQLENN